MATGQRVDPYGNFNFLVEIDGITRAGFADASGFDSTSPSTGRVVRTPLSASSRASRSTATSSSSGA